MLNDNMNISCLMVHAKYVKKARSMRKSRDVRGQDLLMGVIQIIGLRYEKRLDLRNGLLIKFHQSSLRLVMAR